MVSVLDTKMKSPAGLEALSLSLRAPGSNRTVVAVAVVVVAVVSALN